MTERPLDGSREAVLATARRMAERGLVAGSSGNVSLRLRGDGEGLLAITPAGRPYESLTAEDIAVIDFEGEPAEGDAVPSSETLTHLAVYRARPGVHAVVHTHSLYATVAAVAGLEVPPIVDEMVITLGGAVRVAEYGFPGTEELGEKAVAALEDRNAVLLRNHGLLGVGRTLEEALGACELVERVAQVFITARLLGRVNELDPEVVEREVQLYRMRQRVTE